MKVYVGTNYVGVIEDITDNKSDCNGDYITQLEIDEKEFTKYKEVMSHIYKLLVVKEKK